MKIDTDNDRTCTDTPILGMQSYNQPFIKVCGSCGIEKDISNFSKNKSKGDGHNSTCRDCHRIHSKKWYDNNKEKCSTSSLAWYYRNKEHVIKRGAQWAKNNHDKISNSMRRYYLRHSENQKNKSKITGPKARRELQNNYVKAKLKAKGFTDEQITPELIEVQRLILKTKRLCKTLKSSEQV